MAIPLRVLKAQVTMSTNKTPRFEVKDGCLIITMPLNEPTPSKSGKTLVVASTYGNVQTGAVINGKPVTVGLNAYIKP